MLDPWLTLLWTMKNCVRCGDAICLALKYDLKVFITLLLNMHMYVKPNDEIEDNSNMFGVEVS